MKSNESITRAIQALEQRLGPGKVVSSGAAYEAACAIWNAAVDRRPSIVVCCESATDVQAVVRAAATHRVAISVRGGGHDWAGRSLAGDVVVDMSRMRAVTVEGQTAYAQGGTISADVAEAASARGMVAVTGIIGSVGFAGLATGGGYGHLTARHGLALDNILSADVVLADGRLVHADASSEPDLFWAIRGGGGNFGIVTGLQVRLHPDRDIFDGVVAFPWEQAGQVFEGYNHMVRFLPDGLTVMPTFFAAPDGALSIVLHHAWCGDTRDDEELLDRVKGLGAPTMAQVARKTLAQILREAERRTMTGIHWIVRTVTLADMHPDAVEIIKRAMEGRSSPLSWIAAHPFYGPGERIPLNATAFGIRRRHMMVGIYTAWTPGDEAMHRVWADRVEAALQPYALPSSYPNYFGTDRPQQAAQAYGPNAERLMRVKRRLDPDCMFSAIAMP